MGKIYLVDSENVGDIWVPLLVSSQEDDEVLVFYTTKSPHMNYENVRMLKETEKEADFIKCFEGSNALDFQLVSELGYRLSQNADREYVIVSNDTGFDAVVRYWSTRKMPVSRLSGKECHRMLTEKKQRVAKESGAAAEPEQVDADALAQEAFDLINEARVENGLHELTVNEEAMELAKIRVPELEELYSHTRPDGSRISRTYAYGEIINRRASTPEIAVSSWLDSPGHRDMILAERYHSAGIACWQGSDGITYWCMLFCR